MYPKNTYMRTVTAGGGPLNIIFCFFLFVFLTQHAPCIRAADTTETTTGDTEILETTEPDVVFNENNRFTVYSYDIRSASAAANAAANMAKWFEDELRRPDALGGKRIRVELVPAARAAFAGSYAINDNAAQVTLCIRWGKNTERDAMHFALAHAYLTRLIQNCGVLETPSAKVPDWLVCALARETEAQMRPALLENWTRQAADRAIPPLELFTLETLHGHFAPVQPGSPDYPAHAFWFWRHLRRKFPDHATQRELILALAGGQTLETFLEKKIPSVWKDPNRKTLWWPVSLTQIIRERTTPAMTMREAREYLAEAANFVFAPDGTDKRFSPPELIALRNVPAVKTEVLERRRRLRIDIARANPVWHNAWRAYGVFLEEFGNEKTPDAELLKRWDEARAEIAAAAVLETEANNALKR